MTDKEHAGLFREYYGLVYTIIQGRLRGYARPEDIEECVSDVFADLFFMLDTETPENLKGCIRMLAVRRAVDYYRRLSGRFGKTISLEDVQLASDENPAELTEQSEQGKLLMQCIEELGEPDTRIIIQRYFFGHTSGEIAKGLNITASAVRKRCRNALTKLKKRLTELGLDD